METATLVEKATDIVVVKSLNPDVLGGAADDGLTLIEAEVLLVVKGQRKTGKTKLATIGQPMSAGSRYVMASFGGNAFDTGFVAQSEQAVVEVPPDFDLKKLSDKPAVKQVETLFEARRSHIERLLQQLEREKLLLDQAAGRASLQP
jgi:hypothetical protein